MRQQYQNYPLDPVKLNLPSPMQPRWIFQSAPRKLVRSCSLQLGLRIRARRANIAAGPALSPRRLCVINIYKVQRAARVPQNGGKKPARRGASHGYYEPIAAFRGFNPTSAARHLRVRTRCARVMQWNYFWVTGDAAPVIYAERFRLQRRGVYSRCGRLFIWRGEGVGFVFYRKVSKNVWRHAWASCCVIGSVVCCGSVAVLDWLSVDAMRDCYCFLLSFFSVIWNLIFSKHWICYLQYN